MTVRLEATEFTDETGATRVQVNLFNDAHSALIFGVELSPEEATQWADEVAEFATP